MIPFGGVPSDLRSLGGVGNPACAAVVKTWAGDRRAENYDMFHTPGTYMPPTGFVTVPHDTYVQYIYLAKTRDFNARAGRVLATETTRAANSNDNVEPACMVPWFVLDR